MANPTVSIIIRARDMASRVISGTNRGLKQLGVSARGVGLAFGAVAATATGLGLVSGKLFNIGAAALETKSKFETVFGEGADRVREFGNGFSETAGLIRSEGEDILATTGAIVQGMGYTEQASADAAISVVKLAGDIGSFNNQKTADVARAIQAAITGEREQLKRLGIVIREADVQQRALAISGKESASALTQQEKATATLQLVTERAGRAIGDLDRTSDSAANTAKRVRARFGNIVEDFSVKLMPVLASFLPVLEQLATKVAEFANPLVELIKRGADAMGLYSLTAEGTAASMATVAFNADLVIAREEELRKKVEETSVAFVEAEAAFESAKLGGMGPAYVEAQRNMRDLRSELEELREEYVAVKAAADRARAAQIEQANTPGPRSTTSAGFDVGSLTPNVRGIDPSLRSVDTSDLAKIATEGKAGGAWRDALRESGSLRMQLDRELTAASEAHRIAIEKRTEAERDATDATNNAKFSAEQLAVSLLNSGTQIISILRGDTGGGFFGGLGALTSLAGGIASGFNPLLGAGLGFAGGLVSSAAGGGGAEIPVRVERYGSSAERTIRDSQEREIRLTTVIRSDGAEIWRTNQALLELTRADGSIRIQPVAGGVQNG